MLSTVKILKFNTYLKSAILIGSVWLFGLLIGFWIASDVALNVTDAVIKTVGAAGNLGFMILRSFVPLLVAYLISGHGRHRWLLLLLFVKAMLLGFSLCLFFNVFGSAGWLVVALMFLCELLCCCILILYVMQLFTKQRNACKQLFAICCTLASVLIFFDCYVVSPFTASLF